MVMTEPGNGGPLVEYDLNLYHIKDDGTIEYLKDADLETANYPDGYICSITFKTSEFSTFFTAKKDLDISSFLDEGSAQELKDETTTTAASMTKAADASSDVTANDNKPSDGDFTPMAVIFAAAGGGLLLGILATVVIMKMKNKK